MGYSIVGLVLALVIFLPSILFYPLFPPKDDDKNRPRTEPHRLFTLLEKAGQAGCIVVLLVYKDGFPAETLLSPFAIAMAVCIAVYYAFWIRYLIKGRHTGDLFGNVGFIPVPLALFPVLAFGFAAAWSQSLVLAVAALLLGLGHIPVTLHTQKEWNAWSTKRESGEKTTLEP